MKKKEKGKKRNNRQRERERERERERRKTERAKKKRNASSEQKVDFVGFLSFEEERRKSSKSKKKAKKTFLFRISVADKRPAIGSTKRSLVVEKKKSIFMDKYSKQIIFWKETMTFQACRKQKKKRQHATLLSSPQRLG